MNALTREQIHDFNEAWKTEEFRCFMSALVVTSPIAAETAIAKELKALTEYSTNSIVNAVKQLEEVQKKHGDISIQKTKSILLSELARRGETMPEDENE